VSAKFVLGRFTWNRSTPTLTCRRAARQQRGRQGRARWRRPRPPTTDGVAGALGASSGSLSDQRPARELRGNPSATIRGPSY